MDTVKTNLCPGNWAQSWIQPVVRAGVMDTLPNYNFEPSRQVRRGDLALTVSRVLSLIEALKPEVGKKWQGARVTANDVLGFLNDLRT